MGHDEQINKQVYQHLCALEEILVMGKHLPEIECKYAQVWNEMKRHFFQILYNAKIYGITPLGQNLFGASPIPVSSKSLFSSAITQ